MNKPFFVTLVALIIVSSSFATAAFVGFIPWTIDENSFYINAQGGTITCPDDGPTYSNLYFNSYIVYNEKDGGASSPYFTIIDSTDQTLIAEGMITNGQVVDYIFQAEGFITHYVCEDNIAYTFELVAACNVTNANEIIYDISGNGVEITLTNVITACTDIIN